MLTEFARDHAFAIAWFGLMALVWFGWGQEDPPASWRWRLALGSVIGLALAGVFGYGLFARWGEPTALEGKYAWFGALVALELIAAGVGCLVLYRSGRTRWMAWWVAGVVAAHFLPLAFLLLDPGMAGLGVVQLVALGMLVPRLRRNDEPTSRIVGPVMGVTLLVFALASAGLFLTRVGTPW